MSEEPDQPVLDEMRERLKRSQEKLSGDAAKAVEEQGNEPRGEPRRDPDDPAPPAIR